MRTSRRWTMAERCERTKKESAGIEVDFNNWNKVVTQLYTQAKQGCDVILLTGDLVDYGRGHEGLKRDAQGMLSADLGDDGRYHVDRNWFLFYYVLASGKFIPETNVHNPGEQSRLARQSIHAIRHCRSAQRGGL